ncbi:protein-tyrosine phosphatase [Melghiribacillus thermohalophilus]|uniref:protein-tyrosine-phosphatase n=1 Tax=Melghiribacillus thermohalophilus TaxID=1324956 RepID=A0A4R3MV55_9BACI|nr:low molecular weight protein-tyrosine-phosphatase [Melghiribacillus thermohalophilus]TCT19647.1 protein-tyrosine phosphatase [Melghiribacillus thermohalophilus]
MIHVLFVCLGNICRSPMAEAVFRNMVEEEGLSEQIRVDSAGIGHWHQGEPPHEGTQNILDQNHISYEGMRARQIKETDWDEFDYIIAMDEQNMRDLEAIRDEYEGVTVKRLLDLVPDAKEQNVPDPYFTGNFDYVYDLVSEGCQYLLKEIKEAHNL